VAIFDEGSGSLFSGDSFGIGYPRFICNGFRLVFPSTSPTQFEPEQALNTYSRIKQIQPKQILLTHFGPLEDVSSAHNELRELIEFSVGTAGRRHDQGLDDDEMVEALRQDLRNEYDRRVKEARGRGLSREEEEFLFLDIDLNAKGLVFYTRNQRSGQNG
jgi:glyoxylase-like metal-dependent hydrolase (beta-lactamase superfamily II)